MDNKDIDDIKRKVDDVLDMYFEEFVDRFEKKKDIQGLTGWLRLRLHEIVAKHPAHEEPPSPRYARHATTALLIVSILNLILLSFRFVVDPF